MSWFPQKRESTWLQRACEAVLSAGPIPRHVAIIMDGNRRFAVKNSLAKSEGHVKGFDKLAETLEWCLDLGITEVTVYAFSIENFKRSPDEVNCLMELSRQKFARLLQEKDLIHQHGVCVRILGDISRLPSDLQELLAEAVSISANNKRAILNVCFAYTARDDMCMAMRDVADGVKKGLIKKSDISEYLFEKCLYTSHCRDVDLLIRTSGEIRLSDFLMWESSFSCLAFVKVLWPDFSIWHLYAAILHYQRNHGKIQIARQNNAIERQRLQRESDLKCVMEEEEEDKSGVNTKDNPAGSSGKDSPSGVAEQKNVQSRVQHYKEVREKRVEEFLRTVHSKRKQFWTSLALSPSDVTLKPSQSVSVC
ncbi:dehydrodolichyl diphosphate synthase complex subunit DHDDS [Aplysia californica]|uniref:Alkyl transferase n=1 Tax=Aplysia californica TaxID=6500 RepID=A0ABM1A5Z3_APLCA|nr:dehydrodolichyl diphosphate synthase complex subunit DHDDS [Aplysia californica]XP_035827296.1 dehydrodolichyl diphosphate synthase complex subunit DHDDS [Aplysia californica]XP_035827297.1 dehydrodolichyl diphosphate synthase complex subunit DHDDS [Aplysia californica]